MTLRVKLLLAVLPLALALVVVGVVSVVGIGSLGATSNRILTDNYRSVIAAQRMKESIERMDSAALFRVLGALDKADALAEQHSFPLADVFHFLSEQTAPELLEQASLASPIFGTRWRWDANRALALLRFQGGKKVPPQIQRMRPRFVDRESVIEWYECLACKRIWHIEKPIPQPRSIDGD